ncbi:MAG: hypothetical protein R3Y09_00305 [Clostridia bacterium]
MKKILLLILATLSLTTSVCASTFFENSYEFPNNCEVSYDFSDYSSCLHLKNGEILLSYADDEFKYTLINLDGEISTFTTEYKIVGEDDFSHLIISKEEIVISTEYERFITVEKFGLLNSDFSLLLEPILDNYSIFTEYFVPEFDNYGMAKVYYDASFYTLDDKFYAAFDVHTPYNAKQAFLTSNGELIKDFDEIYCDFVTENRYLVKKDDVFSLIDSELNVVATNFYDIEEVDYGKFAIVTNFSEDELIFDSIIDQNGNYITDFNISEDGMSSIWSVSYIYYAPYTIGSSFSQTFEGIDYNLYTQNITRIGFCKLITNFLESKDYDLPEITDFEVFSDTKDQDVLTLQKIGIINGTEDGIFSPYEDVTHEQMAVILYRMCEILNISTEQKAETDYFSDYSQLSEYSRDAVLSLALVETPDGYNLLSAIATTTFSSQSCCTLEESIATLMRLFWI